VERCSLSSNRINTTSYNASGARYSTYFMNQAVVLLNPPVIPDLVYDIARQSRSLVFWEAGQHHLRFIEREETTDKELIANRIDLSSIKVSYTNRTYIKNKFTAVFDREWTAANRQGVELFTDAIEIQDNDSITDYGTLTAEQIEYPYINDGGTALVCLNDLKVNKKKPKIQIELEGGLYLSEMEIGDVIAFSFTSDDVLDLALLKLVSRIVNQFRVLGKIQTSKSSMKLLLSFEATSDAITYEGSFYTLVASDDGFSLSTFFYNTVNENIMGETGGAVSTSSTTSTVSTTSSTHTTVSTTSSTASTTSSTASTTSTTHTTTTTSTSTSSSTTSTTASGTTTTTINPCDIGYEIYNRCAGAVATASSDELGHEAPDAIDEDIDSYWKSEASGFPQWINIEMPIARTIGKIVIKTNDTQHTYHPTSYDLKASATGEFGGEEVTLLSHTSISWSSDETKTWWFENGTAYRHWRLYVNGNAAGEYATICELELYQCNTYSTTTTTTSSSTSTTASSSSTSSTASTTSTTHSSTSSSSTASTTSTTHSSTSSSSSSTASTASTTSTTHSSTSSSSTASTTSSSSSTASTTSTTHSSTSSSSTASTTSTTEPPQNDFSSDSSCKAVWNFDSGALITDSKGTNTLTNSNVVEDTSDYKQGGCSASFPTGSQLFTIADADLDSGFPLKSGDTNKKFTMCFWFKHTDNDAFYIYSKYDTGKFSVRVGGLTSTSNYIFFQIGYNFGNSGETVQLFNGNINNNIWYHVGLTLDDSTKAWTARLWDDSGEDLYTDSGTFVNNINVENSLLQIGRYSTFGVDGNMDEFVVFDRVLDGDAIDAIRNQIYSGTM